MILRLTIALASLALAAAGCGASDESAPQQPFLPAAVADELAARSDEVARKLARGDECGADAEADELRASARAAIDGGRVPRPLRRHLLDAVTSLAGQVECTPPEPAPARTAEEGEDGDEGEREKEQDKDEDKDEDKGKDADKEKGKDKDEKEEDE